VIIVDRADFPRDKLCGDTVNPGALRCLARLGLDVGELGSVTRLQGMVLSGPGVNVRCVYPQDVYGIAVSRRRLDAWLLDAAVRAGARFEPRMTVRRLITDSQDQVRGVVLAGRGGGETRTPALMVIGADGRRSATARHAGLHAPSRVRRWAFGAYATGVADVADAGEMHIRAGAYCGIAPITESLANVCVVTAPLPGTRSPLDAIRRFVSADPTLSARFADVRFDTPGHVLGPLAVDARAVGVPGLLLAGDAAGFVDPMTGDGIHLAIQSAELAAAEALLAIETGRLLEAVHRLTAARRRRFGTKLRFNRVVRSVTATPALIGTASIATRLAPGALNRLVQYAGDVRAAAAGPRS
jgi:flavin-dependent dehydrogenase